MNERIRELITQATTEEHDGFLYFDKKKFAELIVRECIQFIEEENVRLCEYQNALEKWDDDMRHDCDLVIEKCIDLSVRMKQHFGVEE